MEDQTRDIEITSSPELDSDLQALNAYWTEEAMAQATPIGLNLSDDEIRLLSATSEESSIDYWEQQANQVVMETIPPEDSQMIDFAITEELSSAVPQRSFSTSLVNNRKILPFSSVGKMYMTFNGKNYVGTGWVIAHKAVFTAGHCVYDRSNGGWADRILFVPQYDGGNAPLGRWSAMRIHSLKGWTDNRDFKYDLATFVVDRPVQPKTGSPGWMANFPPNQGPYNSVGYPASPIPGFNFNGERMWNSKGAYINGTNPIQMHNNMTPGCSGGPWIVTRNGQPYANGLNSFRYTNNPNTMYSPYFGNGFINLYNLVKNIR